MTEVRVTDPITGASKNSKPERYDLFPFDALDEVARVYSFGCKKYDDWNWLNGYKWSLSLAALLRHVSRFAQGEDRDPESGCHHLAHACWHTLTLLTFCMRGLGTDDRKKSEPTKYEGLEADEPVPFKLAERRHLTPFPRPKLRPIAPEVFVETSELDARHIFPADGFDDREKVVVDEPEEFCGVPVSGAV